MYINLNVYRMVEIFEAFCIGLTFFLHQLFGIQLQTSVSTEWDYWRVLLKHLSQYLFSPFFASFLRITEKKNNPKPFIYNLE